jgi:transposase
VPCAEKNDFNDAEAIAEAVQRPTMKFVATKTAEQLDLQALHRVRERLVSQRTGIINQIRAFMLERGIAVRQGIGFLRTELPTILATRTDALSPRMLRVIEELAGDWRRLDQRIDGLSGEIEALARQDQACSRLMTVPGIGPIISSAMVAAIGTGDVFSKGRDFASLRRDVCFAPANGHCQAVSACPKSAICRHSQPHPTLPGTEFRLRGSRTVNSVKSPTSLSTVIVPPCCCVTIS